jgi:DNA-binding transcriptional regulator YiaG
MPQFASTLKNEIARLAAKEVRKGTPALKRASVRHRRDIAELKREIKRLVLQIAFLLKRQTNVLPATMAKDQQIRFSPKWLRRHREKLDLSAHEYARLLGVSALTVYGWEKGRTKPRAINLSALLAVRKLSKKEARINLELM